MAVYILTLVEFADGKGIICNVRSDSLTEIIHHVITAFPEYVAYEMRVERKERHAITNK